MKINSTSSGYGMGSRGIINEVSQGLESKFNEETLVKEIINKNSTELRNVHMHQDPRVPKGSREKYIQIETFQDSN